MSGGHIETLALHPTDCSTKMINEFAKMVLTGGEVPKKNLQLGIPRADRLFFTLVDKKLVGVSALRHAQIIYHKHLFERAGISEMYNPDSLESCWLFIDPDYRGHKGIWPEVQQAQVNYLGNRPSHGIYRVENDLLKPNVDKIGYRPVGKDFQTPQSDFVIRLVVRNHDPVYNPRKRLIYSDIELD
jgi:hypothetical protein